MTCWSCGAANDLDTVQTCARCGAPLVETRAFYSKPWLLLIAALGALLYVIFVLGVVRR